MKRTEIFDYFAFGYNYYLLRFEVKGTPVHGGSNSLLGRIDGFLAHIKNLDLQVTEQAAAKLRSVRGRADRLPEDATVDSELAEKVRAAVEQLDKTLDAELQLRYAFIITPKRFDLNNLLDNTDNLFAENVYAVLPRITRFDFAQACRCIAFGVPTAAAFHLMRGIEGALRFYYMAIVKRGRIKSLMWGLMIDHLRKRRDAPKKSLIDHLDHIRTNFRNPTQHPDARYDQDEAQDLLSLSIDASNRMVRDLFDRQLIYDPGQSGRTRN